MQSYIYITQKGKGAKTNFIAGCLKARNQIEAYANARILTKERGGIVTHLLVNRI